MQYIVTLPTREVTKEMGLDKTNIIFWKEVPGGRTTVAEEIGAIIEKAQM